MLGFIGKFGSSRGMVKMPNLSGLTVTQAISAIESAGLKFAGSSTETTSDASLAERIKSQSPATNTLLDYDSGVSFIYNSYSAPAYYPVITYGDCGVYNTGSKSYVCTNYGQNNIDTETTVFPSRREVFFDGVFQYEEECSPISVTQTFYNTVRCGYVPPSITKTCTAGCGSYSAFSPCKILYSLGGERTRTRTCTRTDCSTYTQTDSEPCCTPYCGPWSSWESSASGVQERRRTCVRADCSSYSETDIRCTTRTSTTCGACSKKAPFRRTCTTTTINSDCSTSSSSASQAC
jgi:hypothetical protein